MESQQIPENYELIHHVNNLEIRNRWSREVAYAFIVVTAACFGFVGFFITTAGGDDPGTHIYIGASPFILLGLFVAYLNVAYYHR